MYFQYARNVKVRDVEVNWEKPAWERWQSAFYFENVSGLQVQGFTGGPARLESNTPAVVLDQVEDAAICNSRTRAGTQVFLGVKGTTSKKIYLVGNELHEAGKPFTVDAKVKEGTVNAVNNF
jgi:hypothetical protein